jgi:excisionase family DNA binding protein
MAITGREWLSAEQLADELGLPVKTIYTWNTQGTGPERHRFGKHVRYRRRDVEQWVTKQRAGSGSGAV